MSEPAQHSVALDGAERGEIDPPDRPAAAAVRDFRGAHDEPDRSTRERAGSAF
ncbi:hypothetical protein [Roseomonas chloroacetimidivorans]|uniref:hypothetical protein n=1 Tax=Roseomonas chloroacetimidivorans TaxID=1766656 RepID=UPI003C720F05